MVKVIFKINDKDCIGCGNCVVVCRGQSFMPEVIGGRGPENVDKAVFRVENGKVKLGDEKLCERYQGKTCRVCMESCPFDVIEIETLEE